LRCDTGSTEPKTESPRRLVFVVDDDRGIRTSLVTLLTAQGVEARPFADAADALAELEFLAPGCFLIDLRMPSMSGIELLEAIRERGCFWPAAIMTAHGEIPLAVRAMRLGAIEFLEKPFTAKALEQVLRTAFAQLPEAVIKSDRYRAARRVMMTLSPRQLQVFEGVVAGLTSKEIALKHGLSHRTVESYRTDMMIKLGVSSLVDLVELKFLLRSLSGEN
jgi:two-component system, LuxR family, response regulator FixJ